MIIILIPLLLLVLVLLIDKFLIDYSEFIGSYFCTVIFIGFLVAIPISRYNMEIQMEQFEARKTTIEMQRSIELTEYERATLTKSIVGDNTWLVGRQAANKRNFTNWYCPNEIMNVEPIR